MFLPSSTKAPTAVPHHGETREAVEVELGLASLSVSDQLSVGAPREPTLPVCANERRQLARGRPRLRVDDEDVGVPGPIPILVVIADERDAGTIGRPGWVALVVATFRILIGREELGLLRRDVVDEDAVPCVARQVGRTIALELVFVDDDRLGRS